MDDESEPTVVAVNATSAIAAGILQPWAEGGASILACGHDESKTRAAADRLLALGARAAIPHVWDGTDPATIAELVDAAEDLPRVDRLLVCFGTLTPTEAALGDPGQLAREIQLNFTAPAQVIAGFLPRLQAQEHGQIIAVSSVAGDRGRASNPVYGGAKAGFQTFLQGIRARLHPHGVRVMTVKPGWVHSPMTAGMRANPFFATPQRVGRDIARAERWRRDTVYTPWFWCGIMALIRTLPEAIAKRLSW